MKKKIFQLIILTALIISLIYFSNITYSEPIQIIHYLVTLLLLLFTCIYLIFQSQKAQHDMLINEERFKVTLSHISTVLFDNVLDADISNNRLIGANCEPLTKLLGIDRNSSYSSTITAISNKLTHPDFADIYKNTLLPENILKHYNNGTHFNEFECIERSDGKNYKWICVHICIYKSEITNTIRIISYVKDIDKQKKTVLELLEKSQTDPLTGLLNKYSTKENISSLLSTRQNSLNVGMMIDLDNFKRINDTYGHLFGDTVIIQVAQTIKSQFKNTDIVGRIGGDEFFVFMNDVADISNAQLTAEQLCESFRNLTITDGETSCNVSISIGICMKFGMIDFTKLYHGADMALYQAKQSGKNQCHLYEL